MKTKVEIVGETAFNKEATSGGERHPHVGVRGGGEGEPGGTAGGRAGRTTRQTTAARRPKGVVVFCSNAVRVPPKKVELFIQKGKSWCGITWNKTKIIGTFPFDKQPREDLLPLPVWTSRRSTLDLDRVLRHQDYTNVRIKVHLRGGAKAKFSTAMDWILNEVTADEFVLRLNGKYMPTPQKMAPVKVTAVRPQGQDDAGNVAPEEETHTEPLEDVEQMMENKDEGVRPESDDEEAEEEEVVVHKDAPDDKEEDEERWRNIVVLGGPLKGSPYHGVGRMGTARPDTAVHVGQVVDKFEVTVLLIVRRAAAFIIGVCFVAALVDALWEDNFQ